jgi:hypothetical protein
MDYEMPIMDGVAATKKLREAGFSGKIIFATTRDSADIRSAAAKAGCDAFIANPLDWRNVSHVVALHVRSKNENAAALTA